MKLLSITPNFHVVFRNAALFFVWLEVWSSFREDRKASCSGFCAQSLRAKGSLVVSELAYEMGPGLLLGEQLQKEPKQIVLIAVYRPQFQKTTIRP